MPFPSPSVLEKLVPELAILAGSGKTRPQQIANFATLMQTGVLRWLIEKSLYETESDFFIDFEAEWFDCATWLNRFCQKIASAKQRTIEYYLFYEYTDFYRERWLQNVRERYQVDRQILTEILEKKLFALTDKSLRNNFQKLAKSDPPKLIKSGERRGKYKKQSDYLGRDRNEALQYDDLLTLEESFWDLLDDGVSAIAQLLLAKIQGSQRLFIHADYIFKAETQEVAEDWVEKLRIIWQSNPVLPIRIRYYSASNNTTNNYSVYPVCLQYYQRGYYLTAVGDSPQIQISVKPQWYNYRLDRVLDLEELTWDYSERLKLLKQQIYQGKNLYYCYTPDWILEQLDIAYGFDFYRPSATMLLRFDRDYEQKYIKNTLRHQSFQEISNPKELIAIFNEHQASIPTKTWQRIIERFSISSYYQLDYRLGDHHIMMRLLSWRNSVEVILPLRLREKVKKEIEKMYKIYQDS